MITTQRRRWQDAWRVRDATDNELSRVVESSRIARHSSGCAFKLWQWKSETRSLSPLADKKGQRFTQCSNNSYLCLACRPRSTCTCPWAGLEKPQPERSLHFGNMEMRLANCELPSPAFCFMSPLAERCAFFVSIRFLARRGLSAGNSMPTNLIPSEGPSMNIAYSKRSWESARPLAATGRRVSQYHRPQLAFATELPVQMQSRRATAPEPAASLHAQTHIAPDMPPLCRATSACGPRLVTRALSLLK